MWKIYTDLQKFCLTFFVFIFINIDLKHNISPKSNELKYLHIFLFEKKKFIILNNKIKKRITLKLFFIKSLKFFCVSIKKRLIMEVIPF